MLYYTVFSKIYTCRREYAMKTCCNANTQLPPTRGQKGFPPTQFKVSECQVCIWQVTLTKQIPIYMRGDRRAHCQLLMPGTFLTVLAPLPLFWGGGVAIVSTHIV